MKSVGRIVRLALIRAPLWYGWAIAWGFGAGAIVSAVGIAIIEFILSGLGRTDFGPLEAKRTMAGQSFNIPVALGGLIGVAVSLRQMRGIRARLAREREEEGKSSSRRRRRGG